MSTTKYWLNVSSNRDYPDWQEISLHVKEFFFEEMNRNRNSYLKNRISSTDTGYPPDQELCKFCENPIKKNSYSKYTHLSSRSEGTHVNCDLKATPKTSQSSQTPVKPTIHSVVEWNVNYGRNAGLWLKVGKIELSNVEKMIYNIRDNYDGSLCVNVPWNSITRIIEP